MAAPTLSRWQKAAALAPMTVLVVAWGAALSNSGLASAADDSSSDQAVPQVPTTAFDAPASIQQAPAGIDTKAGTAGTVSTLSTNGIPSAALYAYRRAETLLGQADEACKLPWNLVAAIGRVESNHGRTGGSSLDGDGIATPGIYGLPLNGKNGTAKITDTDNGALDQDQVFDRAVGPLQFIPGTWKAVGVDADGDGKKNPQDIDDAATSAGVYLCSGEGDLSSDAGAARAVKRYNHSDSYVDTVLAISKAYAAGDFTQSPNGITSPSVLTNGSLDQTLTVKERTKKAKDEKEAAKPNKGGGGSSNGGTGGSNGGSTGGGNGGSTGGDGDGSTGGGDGSTGGGSTPPKTVGGGLQSGLDQTPLGTVTKPVTDLLSAAEANLRCLITYPLGIPADKFQKCVYDLTH